MIVTTYYASRSVSRWCIKKFVAALGLIAALGFDYRPSAGSAPPEEKPYASRSIQSGSIQVGELERTYLYHIPDEVTVRPALVLVFHGGGIDAEKMRAITAYEFEKLADEHKFILVYPNGYEKSWNGCRKNAPYPANANNIDDPAFVRTLIRHFCTEFGADTSRVFAMGFYNGGHLVYRLALEMPNEIAAIAAVGANLPVKEIWRFFDRQMHNTALYMIR